MNTLPKKINLVENGQSQVFNNWNKLFGITKKDFIAGLEWLDSDPHNGRSKNSYNEYNSMTREIAIEANAEAWKRANTLSLPEEQRSIYGEKYDEDKCEAHLIRLNRKYNKYDQLELYRVDNGKIFNALNRVISLNVRDRV